MTRQIYIVDDNREFRTSAHWWLSSAGYQVTDFSEPEAALQVLQRQQPQSPACLLLDVRMPGMSGLELHDRLHDQGIKLPVIYMTGHGAVDLAVQAMQKGAVTFLEKPFSNEAMESALSLAFSSLERQPGVPQAQSCEVDEAQQAWAARVEKLTPREREVFDWVIQDKLNKTISDLMSISIKTVELHRANLMRKLGATSITHLVKMVVSGRVV
jgi:two-component system response regulator FixJ